MERRIFILALLLATSSFPACSRARVAMRNLFEDRGMEPVTFSHLPHLQRGTSCLRCHVALDRPESEQTRGILFDHTAHQQVTKGNCMRCHASVATSAGKVEMPTMESCAEGCHERDFAELRCNTCHLDLARYPLESIATWSHTREFERRHGTAARADGATCTTCHEQTFCADCHADTVPLPLDVRRVEQVARSYIHPAPYEAIHAIDASVRKDSCDSCHRPTFCNSCHALRGVAELAGVTTLRHPDGWLDPSSVSFHGIEARRSIASCAGCHDRGEQSVCVRCHQVGGTGGNPHPRLFSRRDLPMENRMCRVCHINGR